MIMFESVLGGVLLVTVSAGASRPDKDGQFVQFYLHVETKAGVLWTTSRHKELSSLPVLKRVLSGFDIAAPPGFWERVELDGCKNSPFVAAHNGTGWVITERA